MLFLDKSRINNPSLSIINCVVLSIAFLKCSPLVIILVDSSNASSELICKSDELSLEEGPKF